MGMRLDAIASRMPDFGKGFGLALVVGIPLWSFIVVSQKQDFLTISGIREIILVALWLTGLLIYTGFMGFSGLRIKKIGKDGIEFDYNSPAISPSQLVAGTGHDGDNTATGHSQPSK